MLEAVEVEPVPPKIEAFHYSGTIEDIRYIRSWLGHMLEDTVPDGNGNWALYMRSGFIHPLDEGDWIVKRSQGPISIFAEKEFNEIYKVKKAGDNVN